jgi:biopolymer transport protein TolQ
MFDFLFKSPAWQLIAQSDWMTKLVLLILFSVSVVCIAIVIFKLKTIKKDKIDLLKLLKDLKNTKTFEDLLTIVQKNKNTIGAKFLEENLNDLKNILQMNGESKINSQNIEYLELIADQHVDKFLIESENYLPILGTSSAVAPLMGLFGTVWGLIHSFVNISQEKSADISVVAPGIAEALTTTLAGLIVAIPAMIAFNYFSNEIRKQEQQFSHITDRYLNIVKQTYLK